VTEEDHETEEGHVAGTRRRTRNPFLLPGRTSRTTTYPLRPHHDATEEDLYVPIDHTQECYERFQAEVIPSTVVTFGQLVVVTGAEGTGKTSVVNRCAAWAKHTLASPRRFPVLVDLQTTLPNPMTAPLTIPERARQVYLRVVGELAQVEGLPEETISELKTPAQNLADAYAELSNVLRHWASREVADIVLVVLLPRTQDLTDEVTAFGQWVNPRLLFLAEAKTVPFEVKSAHLVLNVGTLRPEDVRAWASERLSQDGCPTDAPPAIAEEVFTQLAKDRYSIARLQKLLLGVFGEVLPESSQVDWVTMDHVKDHIYRLFAQPERTNV
jgi:hypothetical protein